MVEFLNKGSVLEELLSLGFTQNYNSNDWTVLTNDKKFFAIEDGVGFKEAVMGVHNKLVAGSYENLESLVEDLKCIKEDSKKIADQALKQTIMLWTGAGFIVGYMTSQRIMKGEIKDIRSAVCAVVGDLLILGAAYLLTRIGKENIKKRIEEAWPKRIKEYHLRDSAFMEIGILKILQKYPKNQ